MISFRSDYSLGAHPKIMQALADTNFEHTDGYCLDRFSEECTEMIREWIGKPNAALNSLRLLASTMLPPKFLYIKQKYSRLTIKSKDNYLFYIKKFWR